MRYCSLAVVAVCLAIGPVQAGEKWALLVGVGDYIHGSNLDLSGPPNDVELMEELLLSKFAFEPDHIRKLVDAQATQAGIIAGLEDWLAKKAGPGDTALFYYSGHGSQVRDRNGDEDDNRDEVLCPADVQVGVPGKEINDDELARLLGLVKATDITVIIDACHAGTGVRDIEFDGEAAPLEIRHVDLGYPDEVAPDGQRSFTWAADGMDLAVGPSGDGTRSLAPERAFTMIASCAPAETSASSVFYEGLTRFWSGVLTYNLVQALKKADGETTYQELMAGVIRDVKRRNRRQTPQLEGVGNRAIFSNSGSGLSSRNYVRVTRVQDGVVQMRSASFGGEQPGSIFSVLNPQTGLPQGRVKITRAMGRSADAQILEGTVTAPALAVEEYHVVSDEKLHVQLADLGDKRANLALRQRLQRLDFVHLAADTAFFDVVLKGRLDGSFTSLLTGYEITAWLEEAGARSRTVTSENIDEIMAVLRPLLENAYALKKLSRLDNGSPPFRVSVWVTGEPDPGTDRAKYVEMKVGDPVYFHFRAEKDAYLTLFNVGADGGITILFPNEYVSYNKVVAGKTYTIPSEEMGFRMNLGGPAGQELVKAFATEFPLDLGQLNAQAVSGFRALEFAGDSKGYGSSVVDALETAIDGSLQQNMAAATRAVVLSAAPQASGPPPGVPTDRWSTDYLIIDVK